jgi:hypothetical protein
MRVSEVIVYVEGPSDKRSMEALLEPLIQQKRQEGIGIYFFESPEGNKKESVLTRVPRRAVGIILNKPHSVVVAMPDLHPRNVGFEHETFDELKAGILKRFDRALRDRHVGDDTRLRDRFKVFCFKYDLEALVLASEEALKRQLGVKQLEITWRIPVEDQDHDHPPKRIVERLFRKHGRRYRSRHARSILEASDYQDIADKCSQCFKPFVDFLTNLQPISYHSEGA